METSRIIRFLVVVGLFAALAAASGCESTYYRERRGPAEKIGEAIDELSDDSPRYRYDYRDDDYDDDGFYRRRPIYDWDTME